MPGLGLSKAEIELELSKLEAFGKMLNVPPPLLDPILLDAKTRMEALKPVPPPPPTP
ncbi:MAG: hypothetical protein V3T08_08020 [Gemmatimonadota bacterium]